MDEEKALVSFYSRQKEYELSDSTILLPTNLKRTGLSEIINQLLKLENPIQFDFIIDGKFLKSSLKKYLDDSSHSTENVIKIEVVEATLPPSYSTNFKLDDWISSLKMRRDNSILTGSFDGSLTLWDSSGNATTSVDIGSERVKSVEWINNDTAIAGDGKDGLYGFKLVKGNFVDVFRCVGHENSIESLAVSSDGSVFASGSWDKTIRIWSSELVNGSPTDRSQKSGSKRQKIEKIITKNDIANLEGCSGAVAGIKFNHDSSNILYSVSWDHSVRVWDIEEQTHIHVMNCEKTGHAMEFMRMAHLLITGHEDGIIRAWDARAMDGLAITLKLGSHKNWVTSLAQSPISEYGLASCSYDGTVKVWDIRSSVPLHTMRNEGTKVFCLDWQNQFIAVGGEDSQVHIYSTLQ